MDRKHPEVTLVSEIKSSHVQAWINDRSKNWTKSVLDNHISRIKYLEQQTKKCYGQDNVSFYKKFDKPVTKEAVRTKKMERNDFDRLKESMKDCKSFARDCIEITSRIGLRIDENSCLKREHINLENKTIYVAPEGAKNGRSRTIPIQDKDIPYFKNLLERYPGDSYFTTVKTDSLNTCIRRYMKKTICEDGKTLHSKLPRSTDHAIRKLFATTEMQKLRGLEPLENKREEMKCWGKVCDILGHSENRTNLYKTYVKD